jgi:hypothetical protein
VDVSFLLEEFHLRGDRQRSLFGLWVETSDRVIADISWCAGHMPIVFSSAIGGPRHSPAVEWGPRSSRSHASGS